MKTRNRIATLLLAVCLLLSLAVPAVWALEVGETESYSFDYITAMNTYAGKDYATNQKWAKRIELLQGLYPDSINNMPISYDNSTSGAAPTFDPTSCFTYTSKIGDWVAIKFKSPDTAGTYSVTVNWNNAGANTQSCGVYILPESAESAITANLSDNTLIGKVNLEKDEMTGIAGDIALEASTEYIVVFKALKDTENGDDTTKNAAMRLVGMSLTKTAGTPEATTPEATTPEATTPEATTPEATTPEATTPEATTPEATTPEATTPEATTPETTAPEATTPVSQTNGKYSFDYLTPLDLELVKDRDYAKWYNDATTPTSNVEKVTNAYSNGTINSTPLYFSTTAPQKIQLSATGISAHCTKDGYVAFKIKSPGTGTYSMSLVLQSENSATTTNCDIYIVPADTTEAAIANNSALTDAALVKAGISLRIKDDNPANQDNIGTFKFEDGKDYIVVFNPKSDRDGNAYVRLTSMNLTKVGSSGVPSTGDMSNVALVAGILVASAAAISLVLLTDTRRKHA